MDEEDSTEQMELKNPPEDSDEETDAWDDLVTSLDFAPYEMGGKLATEHRDTPWEDVLGVSPPPKLDAAEKDWVAYTKMNCMKWPQENGWTTQYYLMVRNNEIGVAHGVTTSPYGTSAYSHLYYLWHDHHRSRKNSNIRPPRMMHLPYPTKDQHLSMMPVIERVYKTDHLREYLQQEVTTVHFVPPKPDSQRATRRKAPADDDDSTVSMEEDGSRHIGAWKMHRVHPKIACLFLRGVSTREALEIVYRLAPAIPSTLLPLYDMFANWVRMAVTSSDGRHSLLNVPSEVWSHTDEKAEDWYDTVVARHAPLGETVEDMPATTAHGAAAPIGARAGSSTGYAGDSQGAEQRDHHPYSHPRRSQQTYAGGEQRREGLQGL